MKKKKRNKLRDFSIVAPDGISYKLSELRVIKDVCDALNITSVTVYNWLGSQNPYTGYYDSGLFPHAFKIGNGGGIYIPVDEFDSVVNSKLSKKNKQGVI